MKKTIVVLLAAIAAVILVWKIGEQRSAEALRRQKADWEKERAELLSALNRPKAPDSTSATVVHDKEVVRVNNQPTPEEIIRALQQLKIAAGDGQIRNTRTAIHQFENLIAQGSASLPAIREFLLRNEEINYDSPIGLKGSKEGRMATEFMMPPSLRIGLFEVTKRVGGAEAEQLLADTLANTGRGAEVAYLAYALQELAPYKYRDLSVNSARDFLSRPIPAGGTGLDKYDREYLYGVLAFYGDNSFAAEAQNQLVGEKGTIDRAALNYLQQTMGTEALASVAQAYANPAVDPSKKEPLVRYALTYAGENAQATEFWHDAINDPNFPHGSRRELIEDLNQDGFQNERNPTAHDRPLIAARLALIEKYYNETKDPAIRDAWHEAGKDLKHMAQNVVGLPETPYVLGEDTTALRDALLNIP